MKLITDIEKETDYGYHDTMERSPGVYVRENEHPPAHELDMLWSGNRAFHMREERSPILFFVSGLVLGILITAAVSFFFFIKPNIKVGESVLTAPLVEQEKAEPGDAQPQSVSETAPSNKGGKTPVATVAPTAAKSASPASLSARRHKVGNGDTLGSIAYKYYGSSAPEFVEKLTRANNMKNPNALQLDQELIIPPKTY